MRRLLLEIGRSLRSFNRPVRDILSEQKSAGYEILMPFIDEICINENESFSSLWHEGLKTFNDKNQIFSNDEMKILISFGNNFGYGDTDEQIELLKFVSSYFEECEKNAAKEAAKEGKLKLMLPIYAGMVACILMV